MPGSICLSVDEWIDVSPKESISIPHFLKVYLGKKEFQSIGKESFSFPVVSLRDNLMIMLCDVAGNLITKTELRTILIAEKGETEVGFPLEFGKDVKLRLKFTLTEEEKEKIREMRNSALKRKHEELLKNTREPVMQGAKDYSQNGTQKALKRLTETDQTTIIELKSLTMVKQNPPIEEQKQLTMVKQNPPIGEQKQLTMVKQNPPIEEQKQLTMIKTSDNTNIEEHKETVTSKKGNMIEEKKSLTMVKVLKEANIIEVNRSGNMVKEGNVIDKNKSLVVFQEKNNYFREECKPERKSIERSSSGSIRKMITAFESNSKQKSGPHISLRTKGQISKIPSQIPFENEDIIQDRRVSKTLSRRSFSAGNLSEAILQNQNDPTFAQIPLINETTVFISNEKEDSDSDFAQRPLINETIMFISNERENLSPDFEQGTQFNKKIVCISNLKEENERHEIGEVHEVKCLRNYEKLNTDYSNQSFQIFDTLMPRHLCITTGPKQLRNMIDNLKKNLPSDENQKSDGAELEEENKEIEIRSQAHHNFGGSILNGWSIDKGARIIIVIIAFGTIIFKSR